MIDTTNKSAQNDDLDYPLKYGEVKHVDTIYKITEYIKDNFNRKLTLDDIPKDAELLPTTVYNISGNTVLHTDFPSRGITHINLLILNSNISF